METKTRLDTDAEIDLEILKWVAVLGPVVFVAFFEYFKRILLASEMPLLVNLVVTIPTVFLPAVLFTSYVFSRFRGLERRVAAQRDRAEALLRVARSLNASVDIETVLQIVVDQAREHLKADFGELHFYHDDVARHGVRFSGLREADCSVKEHSTLRGVNGLVLRTGKAVRLQDRTDHPASRPLPEGHVDVGPLLGVPIIVRGKAVADIILVRSFDGAFFELEDQEFLLGIANQAAIAIENARLIARDQETAVLAERDRIAQEMHDGLAQMLGLIHLKTKTVEYHLSKNHTDTACGELSQISQSLQQAYAQVRRTIFDLRTTLPPDLTFQQALEIHIRQFSEMTGIRVNATLDGSQESGNGNGHTVRFDPEPVKTVQLVRIVQEALHNVWKHAGTDEAWVRLLPGKVDWSLVIEDAGLGFDPQRVDPHDPRHLGLQIMHQRARKVDGVFRVVSSVGQGTQVIVQLSKADV